MSVAAKIQEENWQLVRDFGYDRTECIDPRMEAARVIGSGPVLELGRHGLMVVWNADYWRWHLKMACDEEDKAACAEMLTLSISETRAAPLPPG
jgi:hypothetical protein